jgi:hypothetical protein
MNCAICWDTMDMEEFNDEKESTETCFKLECGHAFHTKCIVLSLQKTNHSCPSCNKAKDPIEQLEIVGLARKLFMQSLRDPEIVELRKEFNIASSEYQEKLREHRKASIEAIHKISEEMNIRDHLTYYLKIFDTIKKAMKQKIFAMGPKYIGAALFKKNRFDAPMIETLLIPGMDTSRWAFYRLKNPRLGTPILPPHRSK